MSIRSNSYSYTSPHCLLAPSSHKGGSHNSHYSLVLRFSRRRATSNFYSAAWFSFVRGYRSHSLNRVRLPETRRRIACTHIRRRIFSRFRPHHQVVPPSAAACKHDLHVWIAIWIAVATRMREKRRASFFRVEADASFLCYRSSLCQYRHSFRAAFPFQVLVTLDNVSGVCQEFTWSSRPVAAL